MSDCIFCNVISGKLPSTCLYQDDEVMVIKDIYPQAPVHWIVIPKKHVSKVELVEDSGSTSADFWGKMMGAVFATIRQLGLDKTGYKLVNNGAGYNHFDHEHIHVLGGSKSEPGGKT